jgi:hypothetical protein
VAWLSFEAVKRPHPFILKKDTKGKSANESVRLKANLRVSQIRKTQKLNRASALQSLAAPTTTLHLPSVEDAPPKKTGGSCEPPVL